jgi:hypothetical protein
MKKILSVIAGLAIGAGASIINVIPGWQLGGTEHDINISVFNNPNIISVWSYDKVNKKWKAYIPNNSVDLSNYGVEKLTKINKNEGFWINANSSFSLNTVKEKLEKVITSENTNLKLNFPVNKKMSCSISFGDGHSSSYNVCPKQERHLYVKPGVYNVYLKADGKVLNHKVVIVNNKDEKYWDGYEYARTIFMHENKKISDFYVNGELYISPSLINDHTYWTNFKYVNCTAPFSKVRGDDFTLETKVKNSKEDGGISAYDTLIEVYTDNGKSIGVKLMGANKGIPYINIWAGDDKKDKLTELVLDLSHYRIIKFVVKNQEFKIYADDELLYTLPFNSNLGNIMGFYVKFKGSGKIDYFKLFDGKENLIYIDDFNTSI